MNEMMFGKACRGHTLIILLCVAILALLMLASTAGAVKYAYVTSLSGDVSVIDTETNNVTATVPVGSQFGSQFGGVAVTPDGTKVYVANYGRNKISVINTSTYNVRAIDLVYPTGVTVSPDGKKVYATSSRSYADWPKQSVFLIDTASNTVTDRVPVGYNPYGVAVTRDGDKVYVTNEGSDTVSVIDTLYNTVTGIVNVGKDPEGVAVTSDGKKVYVANNGSNTVSVINTTTNKVDTISVGVNPHGVAISPDGKKVYVTNQGSGTVSVIDTATNGVTRVDVEKCPSGVAITSDGKKVYVANSGSGTVSVIDTTTNMVTGKVSVGDSPTAFGLFISPTSISPPSISPPFPEFMWTVFGYSVRFTDRSTSQIKIISWYWDFGDGNHSYSSYPTHYYGVEGLYDVSLTVCNAVGCSTRTHTVYPHPPKPDLKKHVDFNTSV